MATLRTVKVKTLKSQPSIQDANEISLSFNSLKYSFFVKIIKDWNNLPNHLFTNEITLSNFLNMQNWDIFQSPTNHRSADWVSHLAGLGFFPQENFEIRKDLKSYFQCFERTILSKMFAKSRKSIAILCLILFACLYVQLLDLVTINFLCGF